MSFINDVIAGRAKEEDIDDYIEKWHTDESTLCALSDYLGMTMKEYTLWLKDPKYISKIFENRKSGEKQMVFEMSWMEFKDTGLLLVINQILHIFGWSIVFEISEDKKLRVYPARVKFRGFDNKTLEQSYIKVSEYMNRNAAQLLKEAKDE